MENILSIVEINPFRIDLQCERPLNKFCRQCEYHDICDIIAEIIKLKNNNLSLKEGK